MTPRKELYIAIKERINELKIFEYIDKDRNQFDDPGKANVGHYYTAALVSVLEMEWEAMQNRLKQGTARVAVTLYTKEGFTDQFNGTPDKEHGLAEVDLQEQVIDHLDEYRGKCFRNLYIVREEEVPTPVEGMMAYRLTFECAVFKQLTKKYKKTTIQIRPKVNAHISKP